MLLIKKSRYLRLIYVCGRCKSLGSFDKHLSYPVWGQFWVFLHPEFPSRCTIQVAEVADGLMVSSLFFSILSSPHGARSGWLLQWLMTLWLQQSLLNPLLKQQAAFFWVFFFFWSTVPTSQYTFSPRKHQVHIFPKCLSL